MKFIDELDKLDKSLADLNDNLLKLQLSAKEQTAKLMGITLEELEIELASVGKSKPSALETFEEQ